MHPSMLGFFTVRTFFAFEMRRSTSCFVVKNHGIPEETIQGVLSASKEFFALPLETKMEARKYWQGISKD
jgi:isopenicillin N synthase-like dioxygenase